MAEGFARVSRAVLQAKGLSGQAKLIYALLQAHAKPDRRSFPGLALLAEESGWSKPTVIKAIDQLVAAALVERIHQRFGNAYLLTDSTGFTPSAAPNAETDSTSFTPTETDSTGLNSSSRQIQPGLPTDSTSFTDGVNQVESREREPFNENHLTRGPETGDEDAATAPLPTPVVAVPAELDGFDAGLQGSPGYCPSERFFARVLAKYGALDLEEEAVKMAAWLRLPKQRREKRECSDGFVLTWLGKALLEVRPPNGQARASPNGQPRGLHGPGGNQGFSTAMLILQQRKRGHVIPDSEILPEDQAEIDRMIAEGVPIP